MVVGDFAELRCVSVYRIKYDGVRGLDGTVEPCSKLFVCFDNFNPCFVDCWVAWCVDVVVVMVSAVDALGEESTGATVRVVVVYCGATSGNLRRIRPTLCCCRKSVPQ